MAAIAGSKSTGLYFLKRNAYATDELAGEALARACAVNISSEDLYAAAYNSAKSAALRAPHLHTRAPRAMGRDGLAGNSEISRARPLQPRRPTTMARPCMPTRCISVP